LTERIQASAALPFLRFARPVFSDGFCWGGPSAERAKAIDDLDKGESEMPASPSPSPKPMSDQATLRQRNLYIKGRIPEVREELKKVETEKKSVSSQVKLAKGDDLKKLNHRRVYLSVRIETLRGEARQLTAERKTVIDRLKPKA
jgi:hypothetical protein